MQSDIENQVDALVDKYESRSLSRRELIASLMGLAGAMVASPLTRAQQPQPSAIGLSLNHVSLSVTDVERSAEFYARVLGLQVISRPANGGINMGLGSESFLGLYQLQNPGSMHHLCIGVNNYDADALSARLDDHGITASVNRDPANRTSGGDQLYFNDPDGIRLQLAQHGYLG